MFLRIVFKRHQFIRDINNKLDLVPLSGEKENFVYEAYATPHRENFQSYEKLNKKIDKFHVESIGKVFLLIKKISRPRKENTSKLDKIIKGNVEEERQARREVDKNITRMSQKQLTD